MDQIKSLFYDSKLGSILALTTLLTAVFYNLTPFLGIDCWWHMKFGEYFLLNGKPVIHDPFAVQAEPITATYPNLFPGIVMLLIYKNFSFLGLNIFRMVLFILFITILISAVKKNRRHSFFFIQILLLIMAMHGRVILQPDLFNYALFSLWWLLLKQIENRSQIVVPYLFLLLLTEIIWVNTHPLFFYHGLFFAIAYFTLHMVFSGRARFTIKEFLRQTRKEWLCCGLLLVVWPLANPLGLRAFEALLINMLNPRIIPDSCRSTFEIMHLIDFYYYAAVILMALMKRPWLPSTDRKNTFINIALTILLVIPALRYERCLPFLCIHLILWPGSAQPSALVSQSDRLSKIGPVLVMMIAIFMAFDRLFWVSSLLMNSMGIHYRPAFPAGIGINAVAKEENIREIGIIEQLVAAGNCITNELSIGSAAVFHSPDKPFFWYGHAAVMNARADETQYFMTHPLSQTASDILQRHDIRTIVLMDGNQLFFKKYEALKPIMTLVYMDPILSIYRRSDTLSEAQRQKISRFYKTFQPDEPDRLRFKPEEQIDQYLYLWFSAEYTGNNGSRFLNALNGRVSKATIAAFQARMQIFLAASPCRSAILKAPSDGAITSSL